MTASPFPMALTLNHSRPLSTLSWQRLRADTVTRIPEGLSTS
jgi:hypothetical protein